MNTTQSYLSYIVNLIAFQIFLYIYLSSQPKPKSKEKTNSKTIQPFLQSKTSNSSTRSIPRLEEKKKKKKSKKWEKKKKTQGKSSVSAVNEASRHGSRTREDCRTRDRADRGLDSIVSPVERRYSEEAGSIWEPRRCSWHLAGIQLNIDPAPFSAGKQLCTLINAPPLSAQSNRIVLERTESNPTIPPPRWIIDPAGIYGAALPSPSPLLFNTRRVHTRGGCAYGGSSARNSSIGRS